MSNGFSDLNVTLLELIGYIFPGLLGLVIICSLSPIGLKFVTDNLVFMLLLSYVLGNILHHISENISFRTFYWYIYHKLKECDKDGHGVKNPKTFTGKCAKWLRYTVLELENLSCLSSEELIKRKINVQKINSYDANLIKEVILAKNKDLNSYYQYLHYQRIFNRSITSLFSLTAVVLVIIDYYQVLTLTYSESTKVVIDGKSYLIFAILIFLSALFSNRAKYFTLYRKNILNATTLLDSTEV